jgi:hypothetical protein
MLTVNLNAFARMLATYAGNKLSQIHRTALLVRSSREGALLAAIIGNDGYADSSHTRREVELVRQQLRDAAIEELAFGRSLDGNSWALLVKADNQGFQTAVGRAFRTEMLRAYLDDAVWAAWRTASGTEPRELSLSLSRT